jgi:hypothetical protein
MATRPLSFSWETDRSDGSQEAVHLLCVLRSLLVGAGTVRLIKPLGMIQHWVEKRFANAIANRPDFGTSLDSGLDVLPGKVQDPLVKTSAVTSEVPPRV